MERPFSFRGSVVHGKIWEVTLETNHYNNRVTTHLQPYETTRIPWDVLRFFFVAPIEQ